MNRNIKTITKISITILMVIGILLSFPKLEDAKSVDYSYVEGRNNMKKTIDEVVKDGVSFYGQDMFMNENIYCAQLGQTVKGGSAARKYNVYSTCNFNGDSLTVGDNTSNDSEVIDFAKGLSYILAYEANQNRVSVGEVGYVSGNDCKQLALWKYLSVYKGNEKVEAIFGKIDTNAPVEGTNDKGEKYFKHADGEVKYTPSTLAVKIYNEAIEFDGQGSFMLYLLQNEGFTYDDGRWFSEGSMQHLLLVDIATFDDVKPIDFNIYKRGRASNGGSNGTAINGQEITITAVSGCKLAGGSSVKMISADSGNKKGYFGNLEIIPDTNGTSEEHGTCKIKIVESASNYYSIEKTLTIEYFDGNIVKITPKINNGDNIDKNENIVENHYNDSSYVTSISIVNDPRITDLTILKTNKNKTTNLNNATFEIYLDNIEGLNIGGSYKTIEELKNGNGLTFTKYELEDRVKITGIKTDNDGKINLSGLKAINSAKYIVVKVTEIEAPSGYDKIPEGVWMILKYNGTSWELVERTATVNSSLGLNSEASTNSLDSQYFEIDSNSRKVTIKDDRKINSLNLLKIDKLDNTKKLQGATFTVTLENVKSVGEYSVGGTKSGKIIIAGIKTDENGELIINDLVVEDITKDVVITIQETGAPLAGEGYYYKAEALVKLKLTAASDYKTIIEEQDESNSSTATVSSNSINVTIANQPYITLSGMVWEDGQKGDKVASGPNGEIDNGEKGLAGVYVRLYNLKTGDRDYRVKNDDEPTYTDANGNYSFVDIPKTNEGYKVIFNYDGINYQETNSLGTGGTASKTEEIIKDTGKYEYYRDDETTTREQFNNRFKTVSKDKITSSDGTIVTPIKYNYESKKGYIVDIAMDGENLYYTGTKQEQKGIDDKDFQMRARTFICYNTTVNLDCGLVKKEFDLAIGTDVKTATLTINDKSTTYNYKQIVDGELEDIDIDRILQNNSADTAEAKKIKYNLYLYTSDYNYRITDYKVDAGETILNNINTEKYVESDNAKELQAFVTYSVTLKNQTTYDATVDEFAYYYDSIYTPLFKVNDVINGYKVKSIANNKIIFENTTGNEITSPNYRVDVDLIFKVNKNDDGYLMLKENATNVAEITKYTTEQGGLIDADSAPGNADVTVINGILKAKNYEDDTDEAPGLKISLRNETRTVSGTVTDDKDGDGILLESGENKINGVVVQLIEIKEADLNGDGINEKYEYIWQETKTGSKIVYCTPRNGYGNVTTYENSVTEDGKFEFKDFIPGNYIIRYIYGDVPRCTTIEPKVDEETIATTRQYNGQDYKSTIDTKYTAEWYNGAGYEPGQSVARDNEARRLEVMAHSVLVDTNLYEKEQKKVEEKDGNEAWKYHFTWMAAETSKLNVTIDNKEATTTEATQATNSTRVSYGDIKDNKVVSFTDMDFGLTLRPQTKLVLEKHITGLKVTPNGVGVQPIVDATADIGKIIKNKKVEAEGVTTGLATIMSDRGNRGFWQLATDIEELAQGAQLEVEYTYVIRNDGDVDYLSAFLVNEYEKGNITEYINLLKNKAQEVKDATKGNTHSYGSYLGEFYYTGNDADTDKLVTSRVETIEEALNNKLVFEAEGNEDFLKTADVGVEKNVYNADGEITQQKINTIVQSAKSTKSLTNGSTDHSKTIVLRTLLTSSNNGEIGANLPSYIAEITSYSNAAGRIDMETKVANLSYVHSDDTRKTLETEKNERDEFWAESIIITKPTGEDKVTPIQIVIIAISSLAVIGAGIILIKKFVLKK